MHTRPNVRIRSLLLALLAIPGTTAGALAQQSRYTITGTVLDVMQRPLAGAQVSLRGTNQGSLTDSQGRYTFSAAVPAGNYTVSISFIGRRTEARQVSLATPGVVNVPSLTLLESAVELQEVVVTAPGAAVQRRTLGNAVATVSGEAINRAPAASSVGAALSGKITGAVITQTSGHPAGGVTIRLRGSNSILGSGEPLIVVDGVLVDNNTESLVAVSSNVGRTGGGSAVASRLSDIAPEDIDRIDVLKGASAAALYGSRAKNGVIQIFTKRGQQGKPQFTLSTDFQSNTTPHKLALNMEPRAAYADVAQIGRLRDGTPIVIGQTVQRYDLQDQIFRTGLGTNNALSVSGGSGGTTYYLSGNYTGNQGIMQGTDYKRASARFKLSQQLGSRFSITANGNFVQSDSHYVPEGEQNQGVLTAVIFTPTSFNYAFDPATGRYPYDPVLGANPLEIIQSWQTPEHVVRMIGSLEGTFQATDRLRFRYLFGADDYRMQQKLFIPPFSLSATSTGSIQSPTRFARLYTHDLTGNYDFLLNRAIGLNTTVGVRLTSNRDEVISASANDLPPGLDIVAGANQFASQGIVEFRTGGGFLQEQVGIGDRLFITAGANMEASSAFGTDQRWQLFPRAGVSYLLNQEPFWQNSVAGKLFSTMRVRASYGETGGQPPGAYDRFANYVTSNYSGKAGLVASTIAGNPNLRPERQKEVEAGFDAGLFKDRANIEFTYYRQRTQDLVLSVPLAPSSGANTQRQNVGSLVNRGFEAALTTINYTNRRLTWSSRVSVAANRNKVLTLVSGQDTLPIFGYLNAVIKGQPLGVFYGGKYQRNPDGSILYGRARIGADSVCCFPLRRRQLLANGQYSMTAPVANGILGNPNPKFTASVGNNLRFGNMQVGVLVDGRFGNDVANFTRRITEFFGSDAVLAKEARGDTISRTFGNNPAGRISIYEEYIEDGSFVKLRELSVSWHLGRNIARYFGSESFDVRVAGRNLHTWTKYRGLDPEVNLFGTSTVSQGVDFANTPIPRSVVLGLNFHF